MRTQQMTFASVQFRHKESHLKCFFSTAPPYSELRILHTSVTLQRWLSPRQPLHSREGPRGFLWPRDSRSAKEIKKKKKEESAKRCQGNCGGSSFYTAWLLPSDGIRMSFLLSKEFGGTSSQTRIVFESDDTYNHAIQCAHAFLERREKQNMDILCSQRNESWKIPPNNPMYYDWPLFECDRLFCHNARTRLAWNAAQARDGPTWKVISVHILLAVLCSFYQEIATLGNSKAHSSLAYRWTQFLTNFFVVFFFGAGRGQQGQRGHPGPAGLPGEPVSISFSLFFFSRVYIVIFTILTDF